MSFTWSSDPHGTTEQFDELRTNINIVRTKIGYLGSTHLPVWSWSSIPVTKGSYIFPTNPVDEVRTVLDNSLDNNACTANYSTKNFTYCGTNYLTDDSAENSSQSGCHSFCVIYWTPNYTTVDYSVNITYDAGVCDVHDTNTCSFVQGNWLHFKLDSVI